MSSNNYSLYLISLSDLNCYVLSLPSRIFSYNIPFSKYFQNLTISIILSCPWKSNIKICADLHFLWNDPWHFMHFEFSKLECTDMSTWPPLLYLKHKWCESNIYGHVFMVSFLLSLIFTACALLTNHYESHFITDIQIINKTQKIHAQILSFWVTFNYCCCSLTVGCTRLWHVSN